MKASGFNILWSSQTGNAEWIAANITKEASKKGFVCEKCLVFDNHEEIDIQKTPVLVFIVSNTGDGDPPDNGLKFMRYIRRIKDKEFLKNTNITILGLGDSNYSNFNNTGRRLEKKLSEIGAQLFYEKGLADDGTGLEEVVDPWIAGLWKALDKVCKRDPVNIATTNTNINSISAKKSNGGLPDQNLDSIASNIISGIDLKEDILTEKKIDTKANDASQLPTNGTIQSKDQNPQITLNGKSQVSSNVPTIRNLPTHLLNRFKLSPSLVGAATSGITLPLDYTALLIATQLTGIPKLPQSSFEILKREGQHRQDFPQFLSPKPTVAKIKTHRRLSSTNALKRTLHVEVDASDLNEQFMAGDAFGIFAPNSEKHIAAVLAHLGYTSQTAHDKITLDGDIPSNLSPSGTKTSAYELVKWCVDLQGTLRKAVLRVLAEFCSDMEEKKKLLFICSKQGSATFTELREMKPSLADLFSTFPSSKPPLTRLLTALPSLSPRYYSIANDPADPDSPNSLHVAFNIVEYIESLGDIKVERKGIASPHIEQCAIEGRSILIFKKPSTFFHLPKGGNLLLIGPGTGISPFIGFLQEEKRRRKENASSKLNNIWVISGCRRKSHDWIYGDELQAFKEAGLCTRLDVVESRPGVGPLATSKTHDGLYVQDVITSEASKVYEWIFKTDDSFIYLCGDAKGMAQGVHNALISVLQTQGGFDKEDANKLLTEWMDNGRYLRDVWG